MKKRLSHVYYDLTAHTETNETNSLVREFEHR